MTKPDPKRATAIDSHVGARLREMRKMRGLTQGELGRKLGVSFAQLQKYESGENRLSAARLYRVARLFDISIASFFEGLH